jgi:hypothetical protein
MSPLRTSGPLITDILIIMGQYSIMGKFTTLAQSIIIGSYQLPQGMKERGDGYFKVQVLYTQFVPQNCPTDYSK